MDPIKDISEMMPRLQIIKLRMVAALLPEKDVIKSWEQMREGKDFYQTKFGRAYKAHRNL